MKIILTIFVAIFILACIGKQGPVGPTGQQGQDGIRAGDTLWYYCGRTDSVEPTSYSDTLFIPMIGKNTIPLGVIYCEYKINYCDSFGIFRDTTWWGTKFFWGYYRNWETNKTEIYLGYPNLLQANDSFYIPFIVDAQ